MPPLITGRLGTQISDCLLQFIYATIQVGLRIRRRRQATLIDQAFKFAAAKRYAEKLHRQIGQLMRLIENNGVGARQEFNEAFFLHRQIGQQQMVIDDDQVCFLRRLTGLDDVAFGVLRTLLPETVICRRRDQWPDRRILGDIDELSLVAAACSITPLSYFIEVFKQAR